MHNAFVSIVPLPQQGAVVREGRFCQVSGWGYTSPISGRTSDTLRSVRLPIISAGKCNSTASYAGYITKNMICAGFNTGGKDACQVPLRSLTLQRKLQVQISPVGRALLASEPAVAVMPNGREPSWIVRRSVADGSLDRHGPIKKNPSIKKHLPAPPHLTGN